MASQEVKGKNNCWKGHRNQSIEMDKSCGQLLKQKGIQKIH
jgi:hypothetical protein